METKLYKGVLGYLYKIVNGMVRVSLDKGKSWQISEYGSNLDFFQDGIDKGYLKEIK
ncbi:hypothetical protein [Ralstonia phage Reminis]|uniref:Uncharacterized protein n=1 Tax=Ralstonia phage Reminis TaxID=2662139 RepID=A0A5Q2U7C5_9CAUD|nr:hypothetical protein [Ralstonia phage Reminis]